MLFGLELAWNIGIRSFLCYTDSLNVISLIEDQLPQFHYYAKVVQQLREFLRRDWDVVIKHTLREGNQCDDYLAKLGAANNDALRIHAAPPLGINYLLLADEAGVAFPRE